MFYLNYRIAVSVVLFRFILFGVMWSEGLWDQAEYYRGSAGVLIPNEERILYEDHRPLTVCRTVHGRIPGNVSEIPKSVKKVMDGLEVKYMIFDLSMSSRYVW